MKGIYVLIISVSRTAKVNIGALGKLTFPAGIYAYIGSAQNNLEQRVARHQRKNKRLFWHIDYLLNNPASKIVNVLYKKSGKAEECKIAELLSKTAEPIPEFGSSDCSCKSHLFYGEEFNFLQKEMHQLPFNELKHGAL